MKINEIKPMPLWQSIILFVIPTLYFLFITYILMPLFNNSISNDPILGWLIGGYILFVPLFILSFVLFKLEGNKFSIKLFFERFRIKKTIAKDWLWVLFSLLFVYFVSFIIVSISKILSAEFNIPELKMMPHFMQSNSFEEPRLFLLLIWLPMFFLNIVGEELLWRGYILPRMELEHKRYSWLINTILWIMFHVSFGLDLVILLLPTLIIIPFAVYKTKNTSVGIIIHAILNGPMFVLVNLGLIK